MDFSVNVDEEGDNHTLFPIIEPMGGMADLDFDCFCTDRCIGMAVEAATN